MPVRFLILLCLFLISSASAVVAESGGEAVQQAVFPTSPTSYGDGALPLWERIQSRATPFNLTVTILFLCAIIHTFLAPFFLKWSHRVEHQHEEKLRAENRARHASAGHPVSVKATILEFLGEIEAVFVLWAIPVLAVAVHHFGWTEMSHFLNHDSVFTEPMFVVVIMAISATRPIVKFAEKCLSLAASLGGGTPAAWWLSILILAPLLGSIITEPAAMTISALLLSRRIYEFQPGSALKYATLGLLFVNISVGGVLTNFAAPPVLMVAGPDRWNWSSAYMFATFGTHALLAIAVNTSLYFAIFRKQLAALKPNPLNDMIEGPQGDTEDHRLPIPSWVTILHLVFLGWTVAVLHHPVMFIGGYLFFLALVQATSHHHDKTSFRGPLMVGLFLAGLVIHGRLQAWWLEPVLSSGLGEWPLMIGATLLTAFNDNALITFLASQVPNLADSAKYAIMSGAIAGGGLTVIANAPNPAGQALLKRYFPNGISPLGLFLGAAVPTIIVFLIFMLLRW